MSNSNGERQRVRPAPPHHDGYTIDVRLFILVMVLSMGASFYAGVAYGPIEFASPPVRSTPVPQQDAAAAALARSSSTSSLPKSGGNEDLHLPAGQHLLVDLKGVDADFLNSEERLSKAMVEVVRETGLTLLSYHCHALTPTGVSCVGVLLESHISFHTWPEDGVITLDLFTCGSKPLLPAVEVMERLFGIPAVEGEKVRSRWSHELRGFRSDEAKKKNYLDGSSDLSLWVLSPLEMYSKDQIYSNVTKYVRAWASSINSPGNLKCRFEAWEGV
jgi:S-adenosylmethionine decarboxylase proenzyme